MIDVILGAVLEDTTGTVIGTATGITALRILVDVSQVQQHIAQNEVITFCQVCFFESDETASTIVKFLMDNLEPFLKIGEVLALGTLCNRFGFSTLLLTLLHIIRYLENALVNRATSSNMGSLRMSSNSSCGSDSSEGSTAPTGTVSTKGDSIVTEGASGSSVGFFCQQAGIVCSKACAPFGFVVADTAKGAEEFLLLYISVFRRLPSVGLHEFKHVQKRVQQTVVRVGANPFGPHIIKEGFGQDVLQFGVPVSHRLLCG